MNYLIAIAITAVVASMLFAARVRWIYKFGPADYEVAEFERIQTERLSLEEVEEQHYNTAWAKKVAANPARVIGLRLYINQVKGLSENERNLALASDYYGQVKHALKKLQFPTAAAFFLLHKKHAKNVKALLLMKKMTPIELEVANAEYFAKASTFLFGFWWEEEAQKPLLEGLHMIDAGEVVDPKERTLSDALISAKMYALIGVEKYKRRVQVLDPELLAEISQEQGDRIAKHLGLRPATKEALIEFASKKEQ
jgi:hypothetical protein